MKPQDRPSCESCIYGRPARPNCLLARSEKEQLQLTQRADNPIAAVFKRRCGRNKRLDTGRWTARVISDGRPANLGSFATQEEAVAARAAHKAGSGVLEGMPC